MQVINMFRPDLICVHETMMESIDAAVIRNSFGLDYDCNFLFCRCFMH
jgi:hypothetical protein